MAEQAPPGHSIAAHRAHGWCSHCPGRTPAEEVIAWRARENEQHGVARHGFGPGLTATASYDQRCADCGKDTLLIVRVQADVHGLRTAGGWALCHACGATPHPVMETPDG
ncbi:MAG TPA: hypothetical protein VK545_25985 [Streptomyces sp.]|nr:hypothetical protein [Streptomyces sp.]